MSRDLPFRAGRVQIVSFWQRPSAFTCSYYSFLHTSQHTVQLSKHTATTCSFAFLSELSTLTVAATAMSTLSFLVVLSALFFNIVFAQEASIVYPTTAAPSATIVPNLRGYTYAGCWNETTYVPGTDGARALQNGMSVWHT